MIMEGKFNLKAPIEEVWDFLLKPETLKACVPGCEKMEAVDERTYETIVKQKVGPISVRFRFTTTFTEIDAPTHLKALGNGADIGKAGSFRQQTVVNLTKLSEDKVEVSYRTDVSIVGRLATFGERIMRAKAIDIGEEFTRRLQEKLASRAS